MIRGALWDAGWSRCYRDLVRRHHLLVAALRLGLLALRVTPRLLTRERVPTVDPEWRLMALKFMVPRRTLVLPALVLRTRAPACPFRG
jgi:hypothetical protein